MLFTAAVITFGQPTLTASFDDYENAVAWLSLQQGDFCQLNSSTDRYNMGNVDQMVLLTSIDRVRRNR